MPHHPSVQGVLDFFASQHLPPHLQPVSELYSELAHDLTEVLDAGPELTVALRKLLESKDAAVRQAVVTRRNRDIVDGLTGRSGG